MPVLGHAAVVVDDFAGRARPGRAPPGTRSSETRELWGARRAFAISPGGPPGRADGGAAAAPPERLSGLEVGDQRTDRLLARPTALSTGAARRLLCWTGVGGGYLRLRRRRLCGRTGTGVSTGAGMRRGQGGLGRRRHRIRPVRAAIRPREPGLAPPAAVSATDAADRLRLRRAACRARVGRARGDRARDRRRGATARASALAARLTRSPGDAGQRRRGRRRPRRPTPRRRPRSSAAGDVGAGGPPPVRRLRRGPPLRSRRCAAGSPARAPRATRAR